MINIPTDTYVVETDVLNWLYVSVMYRLAYEITCNVYIAPYMIQTGSHYISVLYQFVCESCEVDECRDYVIHKLCSTLSL